MNDDIVRRRRNTPSREEGLHLESKTGEPLRFTVDLDLDSLTYATMMELSAIGGLAFSTSEGRGAFFEMASMDPRSVEYWTALRHARSVTEVWTDNEALYEDCAKIMAYELQKIQTELRISADITAKEVMRSHIFREAYNSTRAHKESAMHNLVRALGNNISHMEYKRVDPMDMPRRLGYLHLDMLVELGKVRVAKEALGDTHRLPIPRDLLGPGGMRGQY